MGVSIRIRLGPMADIEASGKNCVELVDNLKGWQELNGVVETLCGDLAQRMYPESSSEETRQDSPAQEAAT
jgi:hypothetical protein